MADWLARQVSKVVRQQHGKPDWKRVPSLRSDEPPSAVDGPGCYFLGALGHHIYDQRGRCILCGARKQR